MSYIKGVILVAISAAAFGTLAIFGRFAYQAGMDTSTLLFLRFSLAALVMFAWMRFRKECLPRGKDLAILAGMGAIGYVGQSFAYLTAIQFASAGLVALLLYLYPVFVTILSVIFLKETLTPRKILALTLALIGTALLANPQGGQWTGIFLAIFAAVIYSIYIIVGSGVMQRVSAVQSSAVIFTSAGLVYLVMTLINGPQWPDRNAGWWVVAGIVLIATIIPVVAFLAGLRLIRASDASMISTLEPVVTVLLAALILSEALKPVYLVGGAFILAAVVILTRSRQQGQSN